MGCWEMSVEECFPGVAFARRHGGKFKSASKQSERLLRLADPDSEEILKRMLLIEFDVFFFKVELFLFLWRS